MIDYAGVLTEPDAALLYTYLEAARDRGLRTALLSNAPGAPGPAKNAMSPYFDALVFSGEIGVAKPNREAYLITAAMLGLPAGCCVFVDDSSANVRGAVGAGMVGVHHTTVTGTLAELAALFPAERAHRE
ncbi:HAD-IA family hydrolase [Amycolatopsis samaneae]